jgi:hypothetical protein
MERKWNLLFKRLVMTSVAALLAATNAYAVSRGPSGDKDACPDDIKPGPFAFNYAKDIGLSCPSDFYAFGEFLLMQPQMEGLDYAITNTTATADTKGGSVFPLTGGNVTGHSSGHHDWDYNPGFRAAFGFFIGHDAWNVEAKWTYFRIKDDTSAGITNSGVFIPLFLPAYLTQNPGNVNASQRWTGKHNIFDFSIGKPYHVSRFFIANPFFGLRATWIDQDITTRYSGDYPLDTNGDGHKTMGKNDFWGVGLRGGFESEYLLGAGWNIFGNLSASLLYGKFDISQQVALYQVDYEIDQDFYANVPNLELALGLRWAYFFAKDKYRMALCIAYEFHEWFKQNRQIRFLGDGAGDAAEIGVNARIASSMPVVHGDLSYNGLAFRLEFDF